MKISYKRIGLTVSLFECVVRVILSALFFMEILDGQELFGQNYASARYGLSDYTVRDIVKDYVLGVDSTLDVTNIAGSRTESLGAEIWFSPWESDVLGIEMAVYNNRSSFFGLGKFQFLVNAQNALEQSEQEINAKMSYWDLKFGLVCHTASPRKKGMFTIAAGFEVEHGELYLFDDFYNLYIENGEITTTGLSAISNTIMGPYVRIHSGIKLGSAEEFALLISPGWRWTKAYSENLETAEITSEKARSTLDCTIAISRSF